MVISVRGFPVVLGIFMVKILSLKVSLAFSIFILPSICRYHPEIFIWGIATDKKKSVVFPGGSAVNNPPAMQESQQRQVPSLGHKYPREEGTETLSSILSWQIPMERGAWWATVHRVCKESSPTEAR